ncbi:NAD(P)-dependent oxidoreductase [Isoptericola sp. NPDC019482]|uniref:NAD-dependent epimerase/dehydratase family protein n=1 Tax=Isoptericola sp. NPDC019482 TaxID=3154688 RepID=UPI0034814CDD
MSTTPNRRVAVTGSSGKLGSAVVRNLAEAGWSVHGFDVLPPGRETAGSFTRLDLTDLGQVVEALHGIDELHGGVDAVVHLGAIPGASNAANTATFTNNLTSTYHVFTAAQIAGVRNIVWASSETLLGYPFATTEPPYVPMDEEYPAQGNVAYSLAKVLEEEIARQLTRRDPRLKMIGLRFSNIIEPEQYARFPDFENDPDSRAWNLWSYIDVRDAARSVRLALDAEVSGFEAVNIAAADTVMTTPTAELLARKLPDVPVRTAVEGTQGLIDITKAEGLLGWSPQHTWRSPA